MDARVESNRPQVAAERCDLAGEATRLVAFEYANDFRELCCIPRFVPCRAALVPFAHVEPLNVADVDRRFHLRFIFDENRLDVPALDGDGDGDLIAAGAWIAQ